MEFFAQTFLKLVTLSYMTALAVLSYLPSIAFVFLFIFLIHEYGHYVAFRLIGIIPRTFSIGLGPVIWSRVDKHNTTWCLSLLPFGAYVESDTDRISRLRGIFVALAGPFANFLASFVLFSMLVRLTPCNVSYDTQTGRGKIGMHYVRIPVNIKNYSIDINNAIIKEDGSSYIAEHKMPFTESARLFFDFFVYQMSGVANTIIGLFKAPSDYIDRVSGPVGIAHFITYAASYLQVLFIACHLSIAIGLFNLLPIVPGLDGYLVLLYMLGALHTENRTTRKVIEGFALLGFVLLCALMIKTSIRDISQLLLR